VTREFAVNRPKVAADEAAARGPDGDSRRWWSAFALDSLRGQYGTISNRMLTYPRKISPKRRNGSVDLPGLVAPARLDRRTKSLTRRLQPGDIAIIDHPDLDRVSSESLLRCGVAAGVNVAPSSTGRGRDSADR